MGEARLELVQADEAEPIWRLVDDELGCGRETIILLRRRFSGIRRKRRDIDKPRHLGIDTRFGDDRAAL